MKPRGPELELATCRSKLSSILAKAWISSFRSHCPADSSLCHLALCRAWEFSSGRLEGD